MFVPWVRGRGGAPPHTPLNGFTDLWIEKTKKRKKVKKDESASHDKRKKRRKAKENEVKDEFGDGEVDVLPKETEVISVRVILVLGELVKICPLELGI